jgi:hypothetical protein
MLYAEARINDITLSHEDRGNGVNVRSYGNVLVISDGSEAWLASNSLTAIPKADAQALYDTYMDGRITAWDSSVNTPADAMQIPTPARQTLP